MGDYRIAVVGSGPGGISAAAHAAELGVPHVLLESAPHLSDTIYKYQKGKHVMDEPQVLPLRCPVDFDAGTREDILETWNRQITSLNTNVRFNAEVTAIEKEGDNFILGLKDGSSVSADNVVLAIGLQGNVRKLGTDGEDLPFVQYQLDDPKEYEDETIIVVGAGDAAIENAVALAEQNMVVIVNRRDEFSRAKQGNLDAILRAIDEGGIECFYNSTVVRAVAIEGGEEASECGKLVLSTPDGEAEIPCHRIIARLGAIPPRRFVESCGIRFPNEDRAAVPSLNATYESNIPGLYIIGALGGYPLIKQAMNQGYEVVEFILGNEVEPADEPLLRDKFGNYSRQQGGLTVAAMLQRIKDNVPLLSGLTTLQIREFMLDSDIVIPAEGDIIFLRDDYTNAFFTIVDGEVHIEINPEDTSHVVTLGQGAFFGEMSLISGHRRSATVRAGGNCVLIETPRRSMNKLINSVESVRREIDTTFLIRAVQTHIAQNADAGQLREIAQHASLQHYKAGEILFREDDDGDCLHLIRRGSLTVSHNVGGRDIVLSYLPAGNYVGEMALLGDSKRTATVRAAVDTETIALDGRQFKQLMERDPELRRKLEAEFQKRLAENVRMDSMPNTGNIIAFLVQQGIAEATDVLLIDESLCVRCDNCEKACAETHFGTSRLNREAGPTYASIHVPTSCRHCEHPHCMKECPPDAIHRAPNGEVYIADNCIGCGNCERNCPYGVIQMAPVSRTGRPALWSWLLFGIGPGPGQTATPRGAEETLKTAVKCDMCKELPGGPACVRACPTGAAVRVSPVEFMSVAHLGEAAG